MYGIRWESIAIIIRWITCFPRIICWRDYAFPMCFWYSCCRPVNCAYMNFKMGILFQFILSICLLLCQIILFSYYSFVMHFEIRKYESLIFVFLFEDCFDFVESFVTQHAL
jgi:hypothetical protein